MSCLLIQAMARGRTGKSMSRKGCTAKPLDPRKWVLIILRRAASLLLFVLLMRNSDLTFIVQVDLPDPNVCTVWLDWNVLMMLTGLHKALENADHPGLAMW